MYNPDVTKMWHLWDKNICRYFFFLILLCLKEIEHLDFFRRRDLPASKYYYYFDIESDGDRPAKFQKQQIYEILNNILPYITATREYFYWYISTHTNLGNIQAVKKALARCA